MCVCVSLFINDFQLKKSLPVRVDTDFFGILSSRSEEEIGKGMDLGLILVAHIINIASHHASSSKEFPVCSDVLTIASITSLC